MRTTNHEDYDGSPSWSNDIETNRDIVAKILNSALEGAISMSFYIAAYWVFHELADAEVVAM